MDNRLIIQALLDNPTQVITLVDRDGNICEVNRTFLRLRNLRREDLLGHAIWELTPPGFYERYGPIFSQVVQRAQPARFEITGYFSVYDISLYPVLGEDGQVEMVVINAHDISEFDRTRQELRSAHEQLQQSNGDLEQRVQERTNELQQSNRELRSAIYKQRRAEQQRMRSMQRAEILAQFADRLTSELTLPTLLQTISAEVQKATGYANCVLMLYDAEQDQLLPAAITTPNAISLQDLKALPRDALDTYTQVMGDTSIIIDIQEISAPFPWPQNLGLRTALVQVIRTANGLLGMLAVISQDVLRMPEDDEQLLLRALASQAATAITNAQLFQEINRSRIVLDKLSHQLVQAQETERRRLAADLHDHVGQMLSSLKINLSRLLEQVDAGGSTAALRPQLEQNHRLAAKMLKSVRELALELRPAMLDELGLPATLQMHFEHFQAATGINVHFRHTALGRYPSQIEIAVFRLVQEALTNAARHAQIEEITVRVWASESCLSLQVQDEGIGFDPQQVDAARSSGLSIMQERVRQAGGQLVIEAEPNAGVLLTAEFPLPSTKRQTLE